LLYTLLTHSLGYHSHLLQREDGLVPDGAAGRGRWPRLLHHVHGLGAAGGGPGAGRRTSGAGGELTSLLQTFDLVSEIVGDLLGTERILPEDTGGRGDGLRLLGSRLLVWRGAVEGDAAPALGGAGRRVKRVEVQASFECDASHGGELSVLLGFTGSTWRGSGSRYQNFGYSEKNRGGRMSRTFNF